MRDGYQRKMKQIFIVGEALRRYTNGHRLSRRSSKLFNFLEKGTQRRDGRATIDMCIVDLLMCIKHIINPLQHRLKIIRRLRIEGSMKPIRKSQCIKSGFNGGVRSVNADRS
jgi:hypothetical protein